MVRMIRFMQQRREAFDVGRVEADQAKSKITHAITGRRRERIDESVAARSRSPTKWSMTERGTERRYATKSQSSKVQIPSAYPNPLLSPFPSVTFYKTDWKI